MNIKIRKLSMQNARGGSLFLNFTYIGVLILVSNSANAAVWLFDPTVTLSQEYNDNYRLDTNSSQEDEVSTTKLTGELALKGKSERLDVTALLRLDTLEYSGDDSDLNDKGNQAVSLNSGYRFTERNRFRLNANYLRDTQLRDTAIVVAPQDIGDEGSLDPTEDVDVNLVRENIRRVRTAIRPRWNYVLNEKTDIGLDYAYRDLSFRGSRDPNLIESDTQTIGANFSRQVTGKDLFTIRVSESYFRPENIGPDRDVDTLEARLGWVRDFSETFQMDVTLGGRDSDFENSQKSSDSGFVGNIGATKRAGLTTYRINLQKRESPSSSGNQVEVDELSLDIRRELTEKLTIRLDGRWFDTETTDDLNSGSDREYISLSPELSWRFLPSWVATTHYRYEEEDFDNRGSGDSNEVYIGISWSPPRQF